MLTLSSFVYVVAVVVAAVSIDLKFLEVVCFCRKCQMSFFILV